MDFRLNAKTAPASKLESSGDKRRSVLLTKEPEKMSETHNGFNMFNTIDTR